MERKKAGKGFKLKGHTLPGINQNIEGKNLPDGRHPSSAFQQNTVSPVKKMGIYEVDDVTGERRQISRDEYLNRDEGRFTLTGRDAEQLGSVGTTREDRIRTNKGLAETYGFKTPRGRVAQGEKAQARARELDNRIQDKINEGIPLTEEEKMYQRRAMSNVGIR